MRLRRDARGSTTVEFAVVGWMLCMVTFGIVETGMLWWLKSGMQLTAAMTARCGAIGYTYGNANNLASFPCTNATTTQNYAASTAQSWLFPNMIVANNVTVAQVTGNGTDARCNDINLSGNYFSVSIVSNFFQFLPPPLGNYASLTTKACFPMP
jgi:Flp pilus assembly protein TadG